MNKKQMCTILLLIWGIVAVILIQTGCAVRQCYDRGKRIPPACEYVPPPQDRPEQ